MAIVESSSTLHHFHVIDQWYYLGSAATQREAQRLVKPIPGFDRDLYRILCPVLLKGTHPLIPLPFSP